MNKFSRRQFIDQSIKKLFMVGVSPTAVKLFMTLIASNSFAEQSQLLNGSLKKYIFLGLYGAPPRWLFDLPLTPNGNQNSYTDYFSHSGLGTFIGMQGQSDPQVIYKPWYDTNSQYWLPPVWGSHPQGGSFTNCLTNAAFIRGIDLEINAHEFGFLRNLSPVFGGYSISGALAENTQAVFSAAISGLIASGFKSSANISPVNLNLDVRGSSNPINDLFKNFNFKIDEKSSNDKKVLQAFNDFAKKNMFMQKKISSAKEKSDFLINQGVSLFVNQWESVFEKYRLKVKESLSYNKTELLFDSKDLIMSMNLDTDIRLRIDQNKSISGVRNLKSIINDSTDVTNLASAFATIEILICSNLTQVITLDIETIANLISDSKGSLFQLLFDQHFTGSLVSTIGTTFFYRCFLNCLEELIIALKTKGQFKDTLIHIGSEFNRNPRTDGSGSDHGFNGSSTLLISGMIKKTLVVGNITRDNQGEYQGTWGLAANHPISKNEFPIRNNDIVKTVCSMLGLNNVATNGRSILFNSGSAQNQLWDKFSDSKGEVRNV